MTDPYNSSDSDRDRTRALHGHVLRPMPRDARPVSRHLARPRARPPAPSLGWRRLAGWVVFLVCAAALGGMLIRLG